MTDRISLVLPDPGTYGCTDQGAAGPTAQARTLIALPISQRSNLLDAVAAMYVAGSPTFRQYLRPADWANGYAPSAQTVTTVMAYLQSQGLVVEHRSTDGLLLLIAGTIGQLNDAFRTTIHTYSASGDEQSQATVYGSPTVGSAPASFVDAIASVVSIDVSVPNDDLAPSSTTATDAGWTPAQLSSAYGVSSLVDAGWTGQTVTVGIVAGGSFDPADATAFFALYGISRKPPTVVETLEPPTVPFLETTLDVEWTSAMAPGANVIVYEGPDRSDTAHVYTFQAL